MGKPFRDTVQEAVDRNCEAFCKQTSRNELEELPG